MTALEEMGIVLRAVPGPRAADHEVASWYERKARLLEHLADEAAAAAEADRMHAQATAAHRHAATLLASA
jgi:hypothetical protein